MNDDSKFQKLNEIFTGDDTKIREQLILSGLLLMIFEQFKTGVISRVESFFASGFEFREHDIIYKRGEYLMHSQATCSGMRR